MAGSSRSSGGRVVDGPPGSNSSVERLVLLRVKSVLDWLVAGASLLALGPIMAASALAVALEDGRPVFFKQQRVGRYGKIFNVLKFRSLSINDIPVADLGQVGLEHGMVTRVGRLIRRFKIDELPQLLSVLSLEMSLVGPRPTVPEQVETYDDFQRRRLEMKPGLTGWAQVNGNTSLSWEERILLDVWYIDHWSLGLDLRVLAKTVEVIVRGERRNEPAVEEARIHAVGAAGSR
jgi:lipopolysaccharide/colanic/teichoic acid biosynthesis glycosyltransferase